MGTFPVLAGLFLTAHDFIFVVYGEKWLPVVEPMKILCLCAAITSVNTVIGPLLNAKGRPDLGLKWGVVRLPAMVIAIFAGVHFGGLIGVAWGVVIVEVLSLVIVYQVFRILDDDLREYFKALVPATTATLAMVLVLIGLSQAVFIQEASALIRLMINFVAGAAVYIAVIVFGFKGAFKDFSKAVSTLVGVD
jgi:O-antigen/teichoic acid export membrane protein